MTNGDKKKFFMKYRLNIGIKRFKTIFDCIRNGDKKYFEPITKAIGNVNSNIKEVFN